MSTGYRHRRCRTVVRWLVPLLVLPLSAPAEAFRCGNRIVSTGDPTSRVLDICGEPTSIQQRVIWRSGPTAPPLRAPGRDVRRPLDDEVLIWNRSLVEIQVEEWLYNLGPRRLMRLIRFENGIVTEVRNLGYGSAD